jgi:toxin secretion/phage lysis holin
MRDLIFLTGVSARGICILSALGIAGSFIISLLGGWDYALQALLIFMAIDYVTGLIVAGVFKKSKKSETGALSSHSGFKGFLKKGVILLLVLIGVQLDKVMGTNFVRYSVIIMLLSNELLSILENAGLMGIPIPPVMKKALDILYKKGDISNEKNI